MRRALRVLGALQVFGQLMFGDGGGGGGDGTSLPADRKIGWRRANVGATGRTEQQSTGGRASRKQGGRWDADIDQEEDGAVLVVAKSKKSMKAKP